MEEAPIISVKPSSEPKGPSEPKGIWGFIGRRWFEFRYGHTIYLVFLMSFINFILIVYNLGFSGAVPVSVFMFAFLFILFYVPVAVFIGYLHRTRQLKIDLTRQWEQNPWFVKMASDIDSLKDEIRKLREEFN